MSNRPDILMRVGATFDRSFDTVLASVPAKMEKAFGVGKGGSTGLAKLERQSTDVAKHIYDTNSKLNRQIYAAQAKQELELAKLRMRLDGDRTQSRQRDARAQDAHVKAYYRNIVAEHQRAEAAKRAESKRSASEIARAERAERMAGYKREREIDRFATRTSHRSTRFFFPPPEGAFGYMKRTAMDVARGAGLDLNLATQTGKIVEQERIARNLSIQGYSQGESGSAGQRVDPLLLQQEARQTAAKYGSTTSDVLMAGKAFVGQRGNLAGFRELQGELTKRAIATGTSAEDIGLTAAKIDSALASQGEYATNEKLRNKAIINLLDNFIMQGKVGSVEFENMAKEIPKLSGIAAGFTGDAAKNLSDLLIVTQLAERGPAKNSATASTYAQNFALDLPKRAEAFKAAGINIFGEDGRLRGIQDIITETIAKTESTKRQRIGKTGPITEVNQTQQLSALLPNKRSFLALQEFLNVFRGAGGGQAGVDAINAEFKKFGGSNAAQLDEDLAKAMMGVGNQANRFNAQLENVTQRMLSRLVPAFDRAEPAITRMIEAFSTVITWAAENPGKAIMLAISGSIARAGLESVGRLIIDRVMTSFAGNMLGSTASGALSSGTGMVVAGKGAGAVTGLGGALGAAAGLAAAGTAAYTLTTALLELKDAFDQKNQQERAKSMNDIYFEEASKMAGASNPIERQTIMDAAIQKIAAMEEKRTGTNAPGGWSQEARDTIQALRDMLGMNQDAREKARNETSAATGIPVGPGQRITADDIARSMAGALLGKTMEVKVRNFEDLNFTPVDPGAPKRPPGFDQ